MQEVLQEVERWRAQGERVALATVVATRRSAPRPVGSKLAVSEGGEMAGSVSGGCVESDVYEHAREVLAGGAPRLATYGISDELAVSVGLPCGGEIDVFVDEAEDTVVDRVRTVLANDERAVLFTVVEGEELGAKTLAHEGDPEAEEPLRRGQSHLVELPDRKVFADVYGPPPRLLVFGAVDTAEALCRTAKQLGWLTIVADARAKYKFDVPALKGVLATDAFYVGALGSRRNQERRRERLLSEGVAEDALDRISGPVGLDIGAHTPAETAVSIMAEILATRAGRAGGPLREAKGRIHAEVA